MAWNRKARLGLERCVLPLLAVIVVFGTIACSSPDPDPTQPPSNGPDLGNSTPPATPRLAQGATPTSQSPATGEDSTVPENPLGLEVLAPRDGTGVEIRAVRVLGTVRPDAIVAVNGNPVEPSADGSFAYDLSVEAGVNYIEVIATDTFGETASEGIAVFAVSPSSAVPLTLLYPSDGLQVASGMMTVTGGTRRDAVVGVNGMPVEVNELGIFSATVTLERGQWNVIEVVSADLNDNVNFQTVAVFSSQ
jgi:hypothetical protein